MFSQQIDRILKVMEQSGKAAIGIVGAAIAVKPSS
jgi:hypothetical protein